MPPGISKARLKELCGPTESPATANMVSERDRVLTKPHRRIEITLMSLSVQTYARPSYLLFSPVGRCKSV